MLALAATIAGSPLPPAQARRVLARCPVSAVFAAGADDRDWQPVASQADEHRRLRAALAAPPADAPAAILLFAVGGHLATEWDSAVAMRGRDGRWTVDARGRSQIWISNAPFTPKPSRQVTLSAADSARVDAILADPCFAAEPTRIDGLARDKPPPYGVMTRTIEAATPTGARVAQMTGPAAGLTGELERLITR